MTTETPVAPAPAADTAPAPAAPAPAAPVAAPQGNNLPLPASRPPLKELANRALREGYRERAASRAAAKAAENSAPATPPVPATPETPTAPAAQVDKPAEKPDTPPQETAPQTPPAKAAVPETPSPEKTEGDTKDTPTSSATAPAASDPATPAQTAQTTPKEPRELPAEYRTPDLEALKAQDRFLERSLRSIWFDPNLSPVQKVQKMDRRIERTRGEVQTALQEQDEESKLWDAEDYGTLRERNQAKRQQSELAKVGAIEATRVLAHALDIDPDDEGFLTAGAKETTPESRARAFAQWAAEHSPILRTAFAEQVDTLKASHADEVATIKANHAEEIRKLNATHATNLAAKVEEARSLEMGNTPRPPRNGVVTPADANAPFKLPARGDSHGAQTMVRDLLAEGLRRSAEKRAAART